MSFEFVLKVTGLSTPAEFGLKAFLRDPFVANGILMNPVTFGEYAKYFNPKENTCCLFVPGKILIAPIIKDSLIPQGFVGLTDEQKNYLFVSDGDNVEIFYGESKLISDLVVEVTCVKSQNVPEKTILDCDEVTKKLREVKFFSMCPVKFRIGNIILSVCATKMDGSCVGKIDNLTRITIRTKRDLVIINQIFTDYTYKELTEICASLTEYVARKNPAFLMK